MRTRDELISVIASMRTELVNKRLLLEHLAREYAPEAECFQAARALNEAVAALNQAIAKLAANSKENIDG